MNDTFWYYVDRAGERHGPVDAASVVAAARAGRLLDDGLVWREGLAEWSPLHALRDELGLAPLPPVPAPTPPPGALPEPGAPPGTPPPKPGKGCLVAALVVGGSILLGIVAVVAAISLPAYRDYQVRAAVAVAVEAARAHQPAVDEFVANTDRCPREGSEIALPAPSTPGIVALSVGEADTGMCTIEIELGGGGLDSLAGRRIVLSRDSAGDWYCHADVQPDRLLPVDCR